MDVFIVAGDDAPMYAHAFVAPEGCVLLRYRLSQCNNFNGVHLDCNFDISAFYIGTIINDLLTLTSSFTSTPITCSFQQFSSRDLV